MNSGQFLCSRSVIGRKGRLPGETSGVETGGALAKRGRGW